MTWFLRTGIWCGAFFAALMAVLFWTEAHGFMSSDVVETWSKAIVQIEGPPVFRSTETFYPPLTYTMALLVQVALPDSGVPLPNLLTAAFGAVLLYAWCRNFRERGAYEPVSALLLTALLGLNPLFLRAVADGPSTVLLLLGTWIYARGLLNLRLTGNAPDMMKVAVGMLILLLSHSYGLLIAVGTLPFIVIAARPSLLVASSTGYLVSMFFPVAAAIGSLLFVSAILKTTFLSDRLISAPAGGGWEMLVPLLAAMPVVVAGLLRMARLPRYIMPLLSVAGSLLGAVALNTAYALEPDPVIAAVPALGLVAVTIKIWPPSALRAPILAALLILTAILGHWSVRAAGGPESLLWREAVQGRAVPDILADDRAAAAFLRDKRNVLADVERHPGLIAAMGNLEPFIVPGMPAYDMTVLGGRPRGDYIAVYNDPTEVQPRDRLLRAFPRLLDHNAPGVRLIYDRGGWRIFSIEDGD
ncbi:hypothetical protein [Marinibacterium sp. SX1]|uniref:hypothetical protein n=1 Tax=Marinibacterium sp. SX1 TaxID=3388424 RepID=UPI003D17C1DB